MNSYDDLLTVVILTYNEEQNIRECIESCRGIASRVLVMDYGSTDNTTIIAKELGADVIIKKIHARERIRWILEEKSINSKWLLFLDADERMTQKSASEFHDLCERYAENEDVNGIVVRYKNVFMGRELHHGGFAPMKKLRAFKPGTAFYETADVDEHYILKQGKMVYMHSDFLHIDFKGIKNWVDKLTVYAERQASDYYKRMILAEKPIIDGLEFGAKIKRLIKYKLYYKLPMGFRAWLFYVYCYYIRLGFLDGKEGKIFAFIHSYYYRYLVDVFIYDFYKNQSKKEMLANDDKEEKQ